MTGRADKVQGCVNAHIQLLASIGLLLLAHVALVLVIDKVDDGGPRVLVVDIVSKPRGVDHGELDPELLLLEFGFDDIDLGVLVLELLGVSVVVVAGRCELGSKEGVYQGSLAQARLAHDHQGEVRPALCDDAMALVGQIGDPAAQYISRLAPCGPCPTLGDAHPRAEWCRPGEQGTALALAFSIQLYCCATLTS